MITLTHSQARQFILLKHGLSGEYRFVGKPGVLAFIRQAGCIQYDPIDVCGKNAELVLQSRIKHFTKDMLYELLYKDRALIDYPDKNLSIIPTDNWPYFERYRQAARQNAERYPEMQALTEQVRGYIDINGPVCSDDLHLNGDIHWRSAIHWSSGHNLSRSVLEQMYSTGELVIHHKKSSRKYYDLAEKHISGQLLHMPEPLPDEFSHQKWRILRRIGAVGLLWNRPSDAWLNIWGLKSMERNEAFHQLLNEGKILEIALDGLKNTLYCRAEDMQLIELVLQNPQMKPRCELIAPLDNFMWDRKLIKELFGFDYTWEIYTPKSKRKYGYYVLPLLYAQDFAGRVEVIVERKSKTLMIKNIWYENGVKETKKLRTAVDSCLKRFARFNQCEDLQILSH